MDRVVVAVRTETVYLPTEHEHPIIVKLEDGTTLAIGEVIEAMENGDEFPIRLPSGPEGLIHIHPCPSCGADPYLCGGGRREGGMS